MCRVLSTVQTANSLIVNYCYFARVDNPSAWRWLSTDRELSPLIVSVLTFFPVDNPPAL